MIDEAATYIMVPMRFSLPASVLASQRSPKVGSVSQLTQPAGEEEKCHQHHRSLKPVEAIGGHCRSAEHLMHHLTRGSFTVRDILQRVLCLQEAFRKKNSHFLPLVPLKS